MTFIALAPLFSTQSALGDIAETRDVISFAEKADITSAAPEELEFIRSLPGNRFPMTDIVVLGDDGAQRVLAQPLLQFLVEGMRSPIAVVE